MTSPVFELKRDPAFANAKLPSRGSELASGLDIFAAKAVTIQPGEVGIVPSGWLLANLQPGAEIQVRSRSGNTLKRRYMVANQPGTVDADYRGPIGILILNFGKETLTITEGEKVAQMVVCPVHMWAVQESAEQQQTARGAGGFGSTGTH